jgi:hypothetical protein
LKEKAGGPEYSNSQAAPERITKQG